MGEFDLIREMLGSFGKHGDGVLRSAGDDAAVTRPTGVAVTSIDAFVQDVHFRLATTSLHDLGHKCLAGALSDIAAMGAEAAEAYIALGLPQSIEERDALDLMSGVEALARQLDVTICGGDVTRAAQLFVAVTAIGRADSETALITRGGAQPDDLVAVTGVLGGAAAGLALLDGKAALNDGETHDALTARYLRPLPALDAGQALAGANVSAMIDVSDGVASDAMRLAEASGVAIEIRLSDLPLQAGVEQVASSLDSEAHELAATGGEDYELLIACPQSARATAEAAARSAHAQLTWIGKVSKGSSVTLLDAGGVPKRLRGWDHLA